MRPPDYDAAIGALDLSSAVDLAYRATWLRLTLAGPGGDALSPRERELLAAVACTPGGLSATECTQLLRRFGASPDGALRCAAGLAEAGWIEIRTQHDTQILDLPAEDLRWIAAHVALAGGATT